MTRPSRRLSAGQALTVAQRKLLSGWRRPARVMVAVFAAMIGVGTLLLLHPAATESTEPAGFVTALFTAASAVCVTGLTVVDTPAYWSTFGEVVILALVQAGGLAIMTLATLLGVLISGRGLRRQRNAQVQTQAIAPGDFRRVATGVVTLSLAFEIATAAVLIPRLALTYAEPWGRAIWLGTFHAISAFNNAGFALYPDSLVGFAGDGWISFPILLAVMAGGLGFPVWIELWRHWRRKTHRPGHWTLHTKITLGVTAALCGIGSLVVTVAEWNNAATLGDLDTPTRLLTGLFHGITPRTAGFTNLDVGDMEPTTLLTTEILMFVGGGSAGTAGGIKVTTFALLALIVYTEIRGEPHVNILGRRLPAQIQRQALTLVLLGIGVIITATFVLLEITPFRLSEVLFEVISAFGTVGLSTGITPELPAAAQLILALVIFVGRLGPITVAAALALRQRTRRYERPDGQPIVG